MTPFDFQAANQASWSELESELERELQRLDPDKFLALYRLCCEHLALARSRSFPLHVIERLSSITSRAHQIIYRRSDAGLARVAQVLLAEFPATVRGHWAYVAIAAALLMIATVAIGIATYLNPDLILSIVDRQTAARFEEMYSPAAQAIGRPRDIASDWMMFGFYIKNNIGIAFQCYATGVVFGLGSLYFLLANGVFGGGIAGYVASLGYGSTFFPFVATHSAFELTAIILSGAAGLRIGKSVLLPGRRTRVAALEVAARETSVIVFGAAIMLVIAAVIEAFWSSAPWVTPTAKFVCAAFCWILVLCFFVRRPNAK
ncbi:MAG TPA: stage II sporulation protein M [Steroidobacteraceae bacterium]|nr:stage II sporulation protein M [Steroidobacteraceae bacterium]